MSIDKDQLIKALEDKYEISLIPQHKPSMALIRYVKSKLSLLPKDAKNMARAGGVITEEITHNEAQAEIEEIRKLGGECKITHTGIEYLNEYNVVKVEKYLVANGTILIFVSSILLKMGVLRCRRFYIFLDYRR